MDEGLFKLGLQPLVATPAQLLFPFYQQVLEKNE